MNEMENETFTMRKRKLVGFKGIEKKKEKKNRKENGGIK